MLFLFTVPYKQMHIDIYRQYRQYRQYSQYRQYRQYRHLVKKKDDHIFTQHKSIQCSSLPHSHNFSLSV